MSLHKAAKEVKIVPIFQYSVPVRCSSSIFQSGVPIQSTHSRQLRRGREKKRRSKKASGRKEERDVIDLLWNSLHPQF